MQNLTILASAIPEISLGPQNLKWVTWPWPRYWFVIFMLGLDTAYIWPL